MNDPLETLKELINNLKYLEDTKIKIETSNNEQNLANETILPAEKFSKVLSIIANLITKTNCFSKGSKPYYGKLKVSYGYQKIIGLQSIDETAISRIDFDPIKGYHYHFEISQKGQNQNICIPISDFTEKTYRNYIDNLNRKNTRISKPPSTNGTPMTLKEIQANRIKINIQIFKAIKSLYNYDFLNNINPIDINSAITFELIYYIEESIQNKKMSPKYRIHLNNYLNICLLNSNLEGFKNYLEYLKTSFNDEIKKVLK